MSSPIWFEATRASTTESDEGMKRIFLEHQAGLNVPTTAETPVDSTTTRNVDTSEQSKFVTPADVASNAAPIIPGAWRWTSSGFRFVPAPKPTNVPKSVVRERRLKNKLARREKTRQRKQRKGK